MLGVKQSIQGVFKGTALEGLIPGHASLLLVLPALALVLGVIVISGWIRKTSRALDEKKRQAMLAQAQKKTN